MSYSEFDDTNEDYDTREDALQARKAYWRRNPNEKRRVFVQEIENEKWAIFVEPLDY